MFHRVGSKTGGLNRESRPTGIQQLLRIGWCLLLLGCCWAFPQQAQAQYTEYQIKAGWLCNFAKYVTWPDNFMRSDVVVIGILGDDPFGEDIDRIAKNRRINGRQIEIRRGKTIDELRGAHVIFFTSSTHRDLKNVFVEYKTKTRGILTVGDGMEDFLDAGGIINFNRKQPTSFSINLDAAFQNRLVIHSKLLELAYKFR